MPALGIMPHHKPHSHYPFPALLFQLVGAGTTCSFVDVKAKIGEILQILDSSAQRAAPSTSIGLFCEGDFYYVQDDPMWELSRIFLFSALTIAGTTVILSWAISTVALPTKRNWKMISISSALSAVVQVPIFLVFETEPCKDYAQQKCELSIGSFLLMGSIICSVFVTIITVFWDPPDWVEEIDNWRIAKGDTSDTSLQERDGGSIRRSPSSPPASEASFFGHLRHQRRQKPSNPNLASVRASTENSTGSVDRVAQLNAQDPADNSVQPISFVAVLPTWNGFNRTDEEFGFGQSNAPSYITGDESVLDIEDDQAKDLRSQAAENTAAGTATVFSGPTVDLSDVGLNTITPTFTPAIRDRSKETLEIPNGDRSPHPVATVAIATGFLGLASRVRSDRRRRNRFINGYAFMDDDDIKSSLPLSPPLEVTVNMAQHDDDDDDSDEFAVIHSANEDEQDLMDDWNALHNYLPSPVGNGFRRDPEPIVLSSAEDSDSDPEENGQDLQAESRSSPQSPSQSDIGRGARHSPTKHRRRLRSNNSVSSGTSLLDLTIEEETAVDLRDFDSGDEENKDDEPERIVLVRQRSAPNLAAFNATASYKEKVSEDLHMDGVNSYHRVETWRSTGPMRPSREAPKPPITQQTHHVGRSRSLTPLRGIRRLVSRSPSPSHAETRSLHQPRKVTSWKEERKLRGGIHASVSFSDDSNEENQSQSSSPSLLSRARLARIKRLQRDAPAPTPLRTGRGRARTVDPPKYRRTISPDDGSGSMLLDSLDLQLTQVLRPIGSEYGPEEGSL